MTIFNIRFTTIETKFQTIKNLINKHFNHSNVEQTEEINVVNVNSTYKAIKAFEKDINNSGIHNTYF